MVQKKYRNSSVFLSTTVIVPCLFRVGVALGQEEAPIPPASAPSNVFSASQSESAILGTSQLASSPAAAPVSFGSPLRWGPVAFHPHLMYRLSYGDGLQARPGQQTKTMVNEVLPGLLLNLGDHWNLDYTPSLRFYSSSRFRDTTGHAVALNGRTTYEDWAFGLSQRYASSSQPLVETASQTDQESYATGLNANWLINTKLSLELGASQDFRFVNSSLPSLQLQNSRQWSSTDWLNYQFVPQLGLALGGGAGYLNLSGSSDMVFENLQGRVTWKPTHKVSLTASGGIDIRQFVDSPIPTLISPIFSLAAHYQPFEVTTLSLIASRAVNPSYFRGEITESTSVSANLSQRLLGKLTLGLGVGYGNSDYQAAVGGLNISRADDHASFNARLSAPVLKRGTAALFYQYSENTSSDTGFSYSSSQVGLELAYRF
jgi:hypothetical protein